MNTQEQAYINGFVKRASEQGSNMDQLVQRIKAQHELNMRQAQGLDTTTSSMINSTNAMLHNQPRHSVPTTATLNKSTPGFLNKLMVLLSRKK